MACALMKIVDLSSIPLVLPQLAQWHHDEWACYNPGQTMGMRIQQMQAYLGNDLIPSMYVAMLDDVIGSAALVEHDMDNHPELSPWLASVYVHHPSRGMGTGSLLVQHVMKQAKQAGLKRLYLFTPDQQLFYERLGWSILMEEPYHDHEVVIMFVELNDYA